ncbi:hypothetical protein DBR11_25430 [Pedobacter sp. HMWF019]|uniref:hypothetical protein n=1 Tax=Pedobacter sp. HMWF019 TaxID=2056856 RepID=UPI000D352CC3|nr:hypothetical protein [Pedobacter sp. HMWF019]PTS93387.1 hypothetical protein DBR11_25430 [Pedobacter sp. HMWF019]
MKLFRLNESFTVEIPESWNGEKDNGVVSLYNQKNGVGALQFSFYQTPNVISVSIVEELQDYLEDKYEEVNVKLVNNYAYFNVTDEDETYWRYWLFRKSNDVMFVSYNCEASKKGEEDVIVNGIIKSASQLNY